MPAICGVSSSGLQSNWKVNYSAISAPAVTDDSTAGYSIGSRWYYGTNIYECVSAGEGAAVWTQVNAVTSPAGSGTEIQYRNGSAFGAVAGSSWDGTRIIAPAISVGDAASAALSERNLNIIGTDAVLLVRRHSDSGAAAVNLRSFRSNGTTLSSDWSVMAGPNAYLPGYFLIRDANVIRFSIAPGGEIYFAGNPTASSPVQSRLYGQGGLGTNVVGGSLYIAPGPSTGNATPSSVIIQSTVAGSSGSTAQALVDTLTVNNGVVSIVAPTSTYGLTVGDGTRKYGWFISNSMEFGTVTNHELGFFANNTGPRLFIRTNAYPEIRIHAADTQATFGAATVSSQGMSIIHLGNVTNRPVGVQFGGYAGYTFGGIYGVMTSTSGNTLGKIVIASRVVGTDTTFTEHVTVSSSGFTGFNTSAPDRQVEINAATGDCLRLTYNDSNGSATYYTDFAVSSAGNLTITPSGGTTTFTGSVAGIASGTGSEVQVRGTDGVLSAVAGSSWDGTSLTLPETVVASTLDEDTARKHVFLRSNESPTRGWYVGFEGSSQDWILQYRTGSIYRRSLVVATFGTLYAGNGKTNSSPIAGTLRGTGGSGTNVVGGSLYIAPGPSTGNATPSAIILQSTVAGVSGSTAQTLVDTLTVAKGTVQIATSAGSKFTVKNSANNIIFTVDNNSGKTYFYGGGSTIVGFGFADAMGWATFATGGVTSMVAITNSLNRLWLTNYGRLGLATSNPDRQCEINAEDGNCLRLTYNDANGSATYYTDFAVSSAGNLTITPSGGTTTFTGSVAGIASGTGSEVQVRGTDGVLSAVAGSSWDGTSLTLPRIIVSNVGVAASYWSFTSVYARLIVNGISRLTQSYGNLYFGNPDTNGVATVPAAGYLRGTGGSGTNVVGGSLYIAPGPSTGNATPSAVILQSTVAGVSGSTAQTLVDTLTVSGGKVRTANIYSAAGNKAYIEFNDTYSVAAFHSNTVGTGLVCYIGSYGGSTNGIALLTTSKLYWTTNGYNEGTSLYRAEVGRVAVQTNLRLLKDETNYIDLDCSAAGNLTVTPSGGLASLVGDFAVASTNYHYWGASDTDGSWRMGRSGNDIVIERRESGSYVSSAVAALVVAADLNIGENSVYFGTTETTHTPAATEATIDLGVKNHQTLDCSSATGDLTVSITPPTGPCAGTIIVVQGATARDIVWSVTSGTILWCGLVPTWNEDTSRYRIVAWRWNGTHLLISAADYARAYP